MSHSNSLEQFSKSLIKPYTFLKVLSNQEFFKEKEMFPKRPIHFRGNAL